MDICCGAGLIILIHLRARAVHYDIIVSLMCNWTDECYLDPVSVGQKVVCSSEWRNNSSTRIGAAKYSGYISVQNHQCRVQRCTCLGERSGSEECWTCAHPGRGMSFTRNGDSWGAPTLICYKYIWVNGVSLEAK